MARRDKYHYQVKNAITKDGWRVTADPLVIELEEIRLEADLGAERTIAAEREGRKIAVEIKMFSGESFITDFHRAVGQYGNYRALLNYLERDREIYLAVPHDVYAEHFETLPMRILVESQRIRLLIFDADKEEIVLWKN